MLIDLRAPEPKVVALDPRDCALVVVDMQQEFLSPLGKRFLPRGHRAVTGLVPLVARAREAGVPVVFVRSVRRPDAMEFRAFGTPPILVEGTWGAEIVPELAPRAGEPVVEKRSHDPFNHTALEETIARLGLAPGRSTIVVGGVATQGCVDCAVTGFSVRDYHVAVPLDCTAAYSEELELIAFAHFFGRGYEYNVTPTSSDLLAFTVTQRATPDAADASAGSR